MKIVNFHFQSFYLRYSYMISKNYLVKMLIFQRIHCNKDTDPEVIFVFVSILLPVPTA